MQFPITKRLAVVWEFGLRMKWIDVSCGLQITRSFSACNREDIDASTAVFFPYYITYVVRESTLWILAVAHGQRKPDYWIERREEED